MSKHIIKGTEDGSVKLIAAPDFYTAVKGLDGMCRSQGRFFLIDEGPSQERPGYTNYLFWAFIPKGSRVWQS